MRAAFLLVVILSAIAVPSAQERQTPSGAVIRAQRPPVRVAQPRPEQTPPPQTPPSPPAASTTAAALFTGVVMTPPTIVAGQRTVVTVIATLSPRYASANVRAYLVQQIGNDQRALAEMSKVGAAFVARHTFDERAVGRIPLRVRVAPLETRMATTASAALYSAPFFLNVERQVVTPAPPPVTPPPTPAPAAPPPPPRASALETRGIRANWPTGWSPNRRVVDNGGPWSGNNFSSIYASGGVVPQGGCEIEATRVPLPSMPLADFVRRDADATATVAPARERTWTGLRASYDEDYGPSVRYRVTAVYLVADTYLYKFYLTHRASDAAEARCAAGLAETLSSFTPRS